MESAARRVAPRRGLFHASRRVRPLQAWRAVRRLIDDPDQTGEGFRIIEALKGGSLLRAVERLAATPEGRELLAAGPSLLTVLNDRAALAGMPDDSLGRAYLAFVESQQLSADGLVEASAEASGLALLAPEERWMADRLRDVHDLQHVLTGYGRDELGELCLLSFMTTQTPNRGISFIVFMGRRQYRRELPGLPVDACVREGRDIARRSGWIAGVPWEKRLAEPLEALRRELGLGPPALYLATRERWPGA